MTLDALVVLMAEFALDFHDLPQRPTNEHLAVAGFIRSMAFTLEATTKQKVDPPTAEDFCCLRSLHLNITKWHTIRSRIRSEDADIESVEFLADILADADRLFASYLDDVPDDTYDEETKRRGKVRKRTAEHLEAINRQWGRAWVTCRAEMDRYAWLEVYR
jgi:hypothetical protein